MNIDMSMDKDTNMDVSILLSLFYDSGHVCVHVPICVHLCFDVHVYACVCVDIHVWFCYAYSNKELSGHKQGYAHGQRHVNEHDHEY